jgi:hypothetical protein
MLSTLTGGAWFWLLRDQDWDSVYDRILARADDARQPLSGDE